MQDSLSGYDKFIKRIIISFSFRFFFLPHPVLWKTSVCHLFLLNTPLSSDHTSGLKEKSCTANGVDSKVIHSASGDGLKEKGNVSCEMNAIVRV